MKNFESVKLTVEAVPAIRGGNCAYEHQVFHNRYIAWHNNPIAENQAIMTKAYSAYVNCVYGRTVV